MSTGTVGDAKSNKPVTPTVAPKAAPKPVKTAAALTGSSLPFPVGTAVIYIYHADDLHEDFKHQADIARPGIIVENYDDDEHENGYANLIVFADGSNDVHGITNYLANVTLWMAGKIYDPDGAPGTYCLPSDVES